MTAAHSHTGPDGFLMSCPRCGSEVSVIAWNDQRLQCDGRCGEVLPCCEVNRP